MLLRRTGRGIGLWTMFERAFLLYENAALGRDRGFEGREAGGRDVCRV